MEWIKGIALILGALIFAIIATGVIADQFKPDEPKYLPEDEETFHEREAKKTISELEKEKS